MRPAPTAAKRTGSFAIVQPLAQRVGRQVREAQGLEAARPLAQVAAEEAADDREEAMGDGRVDARMPCGRGEEGQAELGVLGDVAVAVQVDVLWG